MRRVGLVLVGLGVCLIVFALLIPTWVSSRVIKFPLNEYASVNLTDSNASYFSPAKLADRRERGGHLHDQGQRRGGLVVDGGVEPVRLRLRPDQQAADPADVAHIRLRPPHRAAGRLLRQLF